MQKSWLLVADEGVARILEWNADAGSLTEIETLTNAAAHARSAKLRRDAFGRRKGGGTRAGGSVTDSAGKDEQHREAEGFARRVAGWLDHARHAQRFDRLQIAAAPRFLGLIRSQLSAGVGDCVHNECNLDLAHLDANELARRLAPNGNAQRGNGNGQRSGAQRETGAPSGSASPSPAAARPAPNEPFDPEVLDVYAKLRRGEGRELVNEGNVHSLMALATRDDQQLLAEELREWGAACGRPRATKEP